MSQVYINGTYRNIMTDVMDAALAYYSRNPTREIQIGLDLLTANNGNNQIVQGITSRLSGMLGSCPHMPEDLLQQFIWKAGELALYSAATKVQDATLVLGNAYYTFRQLIQEIDGTLNAMISGYRAQPQGHTPMHQQQHYAPAQGNPYQQARGPYQSTPGPYDNAHSMVQNAPSQVDYNPYQSNQFIQATNPTPVPPSNALSDFDDFSSYREEVQVARHEVEDDFTTFIDEDEEIEDVVELEDPNFTYVDGIDDIELFDIDEQWLDTSEEVGYEADGSILGAVIYRNKLHIPVKEDSDETTTSRLGYLKFHTALNVGNSKTVTSKKCYIPTKELSMDYQTLSPRPLILNSPNVTVVTERELDEKKVPVIEHQVIELGDVSDGMPHPSALTYNLISVASIVKSKALKVGLFVGHQLDCLKITRAADIADVEGIEYSSYVHISRLYESIDPIVRGAFLDTLHHSLLELFTKRFGYKVESFGNIINSWDELQAIPVSTGDYTAEEVALEFVRILEYAVYGTSQQAEDITGLFPDTTAFNEKDIDTYTAKYEDNTSLFGLNVRRPYAILGAWLTSDQMGLTEDALLSEVTHNAIAAPIKFMFDKYPTITKVLVVDKDGCRTSVYRGIGLRRALVKCD